MRHVLIALLSLIVPVTANAQYPNKPVRVIVGYAAGSSTDIVGRVMADRLSAYWKASVYVETRAGAAGNLAADAVAKAAGDGYTLLFAQNGLAISAAALPNLPYRAETDLLALAPVAATPHILIVAPEFPAKSVQELIARARAEPGRLAFASSGVGNSDHLCGELFNLMAGIQAVLALQETRDKLQGAGVSLFQASHAEFRRYFPAEVEKWRGVVKKANLKFD